MANLKISQLEQYTGNPIGMYVVVDNASQDTTYKMLRSDFLRPNDDFRVMYGLYSQTGETENISGTTEQTIIGPGIGTLSVPANGFSAGDTFKATLRGHLSNANNDFRVRVYSDSAILADTGFINYSTAGEEVLFDLDLDFVVSAIGGAGTGAILSKGRIRTIKNSNFTVNGYSFETHNTTTFNTTIENILNVTIEFDTTAADTYTYTDFFTLTKVY